MSSLPGTGISVKTLSGNATIQTNQPDPVQGAAVTQRVGSNGWPSGDDTPLATDTEDGRMSAGAVRKLALELNVCDFTIAGASLTPSNFTAALQAAVSFANLLGSAATVIMPAGRWNITAPVYLPGRGYAYPSLLLEGAGTGSTTLVSTLSSGWTFHLDGKQAGVNGSIELYMHGGLKNFTIEAAGTAANGVKLTGCVFCSLTGIRIKGFNAACDGITNGVGMRLDGQGDYSIQNTLFHDLRIEQCVTGLQMAAIAQCHFAHVSLNQNTNDIWDEGDVEFSWDTGMFQSGSGADVNNPYYGRPFWTYRAIGRAYASGTGAAMSAPVAGVVTVTLLSSVPAEALDDLHHLQLTGDADTRNNGVFEIVARVSATSVQIAKTVGTATTGLAWTLKKNPGGQAVHMYGNFYHENFIKGMFKLGRPSLQQSVFYLSGFSVYNIEVFADIRGLQAFKGTSFNRSPSVAWLKARACHDIQIETDDDRTPVSAPTFFDLDMYSRQQLKMRAGGKDYRGSNPLSDILGMLANNAAEIFDARSGVVLDANGLVQSWTGLKGAIATAPSAGRRPIMIRRSAQLGGNPAIGMRSNGNRTMNGTFVTPIPTGSHPAMLVIGALPTFAAPIQYGGSRGPCMFDATGVNQMYVSVNDSVAASGFVDTWWAVPGKSMVRYNRAMPSSGRVLTYHGAYRPDGINSAHYTLMLEGNLNNGAFSSTTEDAVTTTAPITTFQTTGVYGAHAGNEFDLCLVAYLHTALSPDELIQLFARLQQLYTSDAPSRQWMPTITASPAAPQDYSLHDVLVPVSLASANVTYAIPAGHRRGDRVSFKVTTAAGGRSLTLDPNGSETIDGAATLVLSTDYAYAALESDGTNWFKVS